MLPVKHFTLLTIVSVAVVSEEHVIIGNITHHNEKLEPNLKHNFARLLKSIVQVNEERVGAMKKLLKLESLSNIKSNLRTVQDENYDSDNSLENRNVLAVFVINNPTLRNGAADSVAKYKNNVSLEMTSDSSDNTDNDNSANEIKNDSPLDILDEKINTEGVLNLNKQQLEMLRRGWKSSCSRAAARNCRKACRRAGKDACTEYRCGRSLKRRFKRSCRSSCKSYFTGSGYDTGSSDSDIV